jgi:hypothetical protein
LFEETPPMGPFFLILLTLDPRTGDFVKSTVVGESYASIRACMNEAIERGPRKTADDRATLLVCQAAGGEYTSNVPQPVGAT